MVVSDLKAVEGTNDLTTSELKLNDSMMVNI